MISDYPTKSGGDKHCGSGDLMGFFLRDLTRPHIMVCLSRDHERTPDLRTT